MVVIAPSRFNLALLALALAGTVALSLAASCAICVSAPAVQVSETSRVKVTEGLLRQTALHLSKMLEGASIGGFPGFEPPDDDEKYRRKIKDQTYTAQDVNDWLKQINNFLNQIVKKNPGLTLEEVLERQGLTQIQSQNFIAALQRIHYTADGMKGLGVSEKIVETLASLLKTLGVPTWVY
jgi:hypothetical protein